MYVYIHMYTRACIHVFGSTSAAFRCFSGYRARKASARDDDETSASNAKQGRSEESIQQKREKRREVLERRKRKPDYQATCLDCDFFGCRPFELKKNIWSKNTHTHKDTHTTVKRVPPGEKRHDGMKWHGICVGGFPCYTVLHPAILVK